MKGLYDIDPCMCGMGIAIALWGLGKGISLIYQARAGNEAMAARSSALEKLIETQGKQMGPQEFKDYAASFGLADRNNEE